MAPPVVLHVIPSLEMGGAERMLTSLVTAKRSRNFDQCVVSLMKGGAFSEQIGNAGVPLYELEMSQPNFPAVVFRLASLIRKLSPVAIQSWLYYGDLAATAALYLSGRRHRTRFYWGVRSSDILKSNYSRRLRLSVAACARLSRFPDAIVANSYAGRLDHQRIGYRPPEFLVIPNGIDTTRFSPDPAARGRVRTELNIPATSVFVIHVARVDQMKDHGTFLKVAEAMPKVQFAVVGRGTETLPAPPNVMCLGMRDNMETIYAAADYLVSTSIFGEGFSNVIAEGMSSGVPAIATEIGDAREIIGNTGYVTRPGSVTDIVDALQSVMREPEDQRKNRANLCRDRIISHFSLERAVANFDALHFGDHRE
jgi:glycosyltransferase involved in cell wall biosynthesis